MCQVMDSEAGMHNISIARNAAGICHRELAVSSNATCGRPLSGWFAVLFACVPSHLTLTRRASAQRPYTELQRAFGVHWGCSALAEPVP